MLIRGRPIPAELVILRILNGKMEFTEREKLHLSNQEKGYEGEMKFDKLTAGLENENLILNDLLLEVGESLFQIDTLIIFSGVIHLIDVKYFEGEYYYDEKELFKTKTGSEKKDPLLQLKRCHSLFRQLIQKYGFNFHTEAHLVFNNPEFTLFHPTQNPQIILPTQLNSFIKKLQKIPSRLNERHSKLADMLVSLHITENPYSRLPKYDFDMLKKAMFCGNCHLSSLSINRKKITCNQCGHVEDVDSVILRSVDELKLLFPGIKITTKLVHDWCGGSVSMKTIRRILKKNLKATGNTKESYYE
ncbi:nuclease-related domain-containing protein [Neobacillus vireti]|uniref:nuclease-related domain-containing protein n=1 Tax=Neobacillus vireti TaxID=220686 RepID=UPI002FFEE348